MKFFKANKIYLDSETTAEQLRSARQKKNLKLSEVAKKLNINLKYLELLEKGEYARLPHGVYGKNFLREYALFLGLDYKKLLNDYEAELNLADPKRQKEIFSKQVIKPSYLLATPKILKNIFIALLITVCFVYLGYRVKKIIAPPRLVVTSPLADLITEQTDLLVAGKTEPEAALTINQETVLSDQAGNFSKIISLKNGLNVITIMASKKYGRSQTVIRQVLVK